MEKARCTHHPRHGTPCAIVNTGSKQGITNPPGNPAYNVSKAGVKAVSEGLAHELRSIDGFQVSAHLLMPGFTYTGMTAAAVPNKPPAAWTPDQVAQRLLERIGGGDFYVICPDSDVTEAMDHARMQWNLDDMVRNRPALSRWHPDFSAAFEQHMHDALRCVADVAKAVTGDRGQTRFVSVFGHPHVVGRYHVQIGHPITLGAVIGFQLQTVSDLKMVQAAEEAVAMSRNGAIAVPLQRPSFRQAPSVSFASSMPAKTGIRSCRSWAATPG